MRLADRHRVAFGALARTPLRTAMLLLATAIGVAAVLMLTALGEAARRYITDEFQSLGTDLLVVLPGRTETTGAGAGMMSGATPRDITLDDARALLRSSAIATVAPLVVGESQVSVGSLERDVTIMGTTASYAAIRRWTMASGEFLPDVDMDRESPVCVIGHTIGRELFRGEPPVGRWLRVGDRRCRVAGLLAKQGISVMVDVDTVVMIPVAMAQSLFNSAGLFRVLIQARSRDVMPAARRFVLDTFRERHHGEEDVTVITQDAVLKTFDGILGALTMALAGIAAVSLLVAGVLIMNVMLVAVSQRTQEIGLLKALGARRSQVLALFLTEAVYLAMLGAFAGLLLGFAGVWLLGSLYPDFTFRPPLWAVAGAVLTSMACGMLFGILPARHAARLDPVAALARR
jgi:putative ABC transport system permease protein